LAQFARHPKNSTSQTFLLKISHACPHHCKRPGTTYQSSLTMHTRYECGYVTVCLHIMCIDDYVTVYCSKILPCYKFLYQRKWPRGRCASVSTFKKCRSTHTHTHFVFKGLKLFNGHGQAGE
jgi:hypothetical protein